MTIRKYIIYIILAIILNFFIYEFFIWNFVYKSNYKEYNWYKFARQEWTTARGMYEGYFKWEINIYWSTIKFDNNNDQNRVLILWDSFTEAENIFPEDHFISMLKNDFSDIEFINMSRGWSNFTDYIKSKEFYYSKTDKDFVHVFVYLSYWDFLDSYKNTKGHFKINENNQIEYVRFIDSKQRELILSVLNSSSSFWFFIDKLNRIVKSWNFNLLASPSKKESKKSYINYEWWLSDEEIKKIIFQLNIFNKEYWKENVTFLLPTKFSVIDSINWIKNQKIDDLIILLEKNNYNYFDLRQDFISDYLLEKRHTAHGFYNWRIRSWWHINKRGHTIIYNKLKEYINNNKEWFLLN
jgi:hypothetical protein